MQDYATAKLALSGTLISSWWWFEPLQAASQVAAAFAAFVGLIIGVITLYRMLRH